MLVLRIFAGIYAASLHSCLFIVMVFPLSVLILRDLSQCLGSEAMMPPLITDSFVVSQTMRHRLKTTSTDQKLLREFQPWKNKYFMTL